VANSANIAQGDETLTVAELTQMVVRAIETSKVLSLSDTC
jgi:hypothetical protein